MKKTNGKSKGTGILIGVVVSVICLFMRTFLHKHNEGTIALIISCVGLIAMLFGSIFMLICAIKEFKNKKAGVKGERKTLVLSILFSLMALLLLVFSIVLAKNIIPDVVEGPSSFELLECRLSLDEAYGSRRHYHPESYYLNGKDKDGEEYEFRLNYKSFSELVEVAGSNIFDYKYYDFNYLELPDMYIKCYKNSEILISYEIEKEKIEEKRYTEYSVGQIKKDYEQNNAQFDYKYMEAYVSVTGKVEEITDIGVYLEALDSEEEIDNQLEDINELYWMTECSVCGWLDDEHVEKISGIEVGDTVTIKGQVSSTMFGCWISVDEIQLH